MFSSASHSLASSWFMNQRKSAWLWIDKIPTGLATWLPNGEFSPNLWPLSSFLSPWLQKPNDPLLTHLKGNPKLLPDTFGILWNAVWCVHVGGIYRRGRSVCLDGDTIFRRIPYSLTAFMGKRSSSGCDDFANLQVCLSHCCFLLAATPNSMDRPQIPFRPNHDAGMEKIASGGHGECAGHSSHYLVG